MIGAAQQECIMKLTFKPVFVPRIWLGVRMLRLAFWIIGGTAEVSE